MKVSYHATITVAKSQVLIECVLKMLFCSNSIPKAIDFFCYIIYIKHNVHNMKMLQEITADNHSPVGNALSMWLFFIERLQCITLCELCGE